MEHAVTLRLSITTSSDVLLSARTVINYLSMLSSTENKIAIANNK